MKLNPGQYEGLARLSVIAAAILLLLAAIGRIIGQMLLLTGEQYVLLAIAALLFGIYFNMDRMRETALENIGKLMSLLSKEAPK